MKKNYFVMVKSIIFNGLKDKNPGEIYKKILQPITKTPKMEFLSRQCFTKWIFSKKCLKKK